MTTKVSMTNKSKEVKSNLNQVIDVIQEDISGSATRRKYQTFVTGGIGPGVTSSLYQTVYDQDFTLQTANPVADMTVGLFQYDKGNAVRRNLVTENTQTGYAKSTTTGQISFSSRNTMMMREKVNIYRQYAQYLLGNANYAFTLGSSFPSSNKIANIVTNEGTLMQNDTTIIDAALFINVKRLFKRDSIRKETFAIRLYKNAPDWNTVANTQTNYAYHYDTTGTVLAAATAPANYKNNVLGTTVESSARGVRIIADIRANTAGNNMNHPVSGDVGLLRLAADSTKVVGLIFYQAGIAILNLGGSSLTTGLNQNAADKSTGPIDIGLGQIGAAGGASASTIEAVFEQRDPMYGVLAGMDDGAGTDAGSIGSKTTGQVYLGIGTQHTDASNFKVSERTASTVSGVANSGARGPGTFYPDLLVSASIDDIIDHIGYTRFSSGSLTGMAFQNTTKIESTIYFCRAEANQFNVSNNATWKKSNTDSSGVMIQTEGDTAFTYITTVLLYDDANPNEPVAIAKLNRPIEKNEESEVTVRVRLDF